MFQIIYLLVVVTVCHATKDEIKRKTRNPGLLHLVHAGESVGSYVDGSQRSYLGGGSGGPHIVIVGGEGARVSSHVASKDSLEELDEDLRQHYTPGGKYSPNSSFGKLYVPDHSGRTHHLGFIGHYGGHLPGVAVGHHPGFAISHGGGHPGLGYKIAPFLLNHPQVIQNPTYAHVSSAVGHPVTNNQHHHQAGHSQYQGGHHAATPSSINYGSPTPHTLSATPTPLTHTLATPIHNQHIPLPHALHNGAVHGLHGALGHGGPVFIPVQSAAAHTPYHGHNFGVDHSQSAGFTQHRGSGGGFKYFPASYGSEQHRTGNAEDNPQRYYDDVEERRSNENTQRVMDYESGSKEKQRVENYPELGESDKSFKYDSEENMSKSAQTAAALRSNFPTDEKSSVEDISSLEHSAERSPFNNFKFNFPNQFGSNGRSFTGNDKVATSYQSIVLETRSEPLYLSKKSHQ